MNNYYPLTIPGIPATNYVNYPLRGVQAFSGLPLTNCEKAWEDYESERQRVTALSTKLAPIAAQCHSQHAKYDQEKSDYDQAVAKRDACATAHADYQVLYAKYARSKKESEDCVAFRKNYAAYQEEVKRIAAENAKRKADYEAVDAAVRKLNADRVIKYRAKVAEYEKALAAWEALFAKWQAYGSAISGQKYSIAMQWRSTVAAKPELQRYNWAYRTGRCGTFFDCMTSSMKSYLLRSGGPCDPVRGVGALGATNPTASDCMHARYWPTCPSACPSACPTKPSPELGPKPVKPAEPTYAKRPAPPTYLAAPTWEQYAAAQQIPTRTFPGTACQVPPPPPPIPPCDQEKPLPPVPLQPTCTPPEIPKMPVKPGCDRPLLGTSTTGIALAGAGLLTLLLLSRKRKS